MPTAPRAGEAYLAFGPAPADQRPDATTSRPPATSAKPPATSSPCCTTLDARAAAIAVAPIPQTGLGEAINDRLRRAAAPRA